MHSCHRPRMKTDDDAALFQHRMLLLSVLKSAHLQYVELGCSGHIPLHWHQVVTFCYYLLYQLGTGGCTQKAEPVRGVYP